jgi:hypothetical protein
MSAVRRSVVSLLVAALLTACSARRPAPGVARTSAPAPMTLASAPPSASVAPSPLSSCLLLPQFCGPQPTPAPVRAVSELPDAPPIRSKATLIVSGTRHVCALLADRTVSCWGENQLGQLGGGDRNWVDRFGPPSHRVIMDGVHLAAHVDRTCAVTATGFVECWGDLRGHALEGGLPASCTDCNCTSAAPVRVAGVSNARAVAVGAQHTCALLGTGRVVCWGDNRFGQVGLGHTRVVPSDGGGPKEVVGLRDVAEIDAGDYSTCALRRDGAVFCWGSNAEGQLGAGSRGACGKDGRHNCTPAPLQPQGLPPIQEIDVAPRHACARTASGRVFCWGANDRRQLAMIGPNTCLRGQYDSCATASGLSDTHAIACGMSAREVPLPSPARLAVADDAATCAFFEDQRYWCWSGTCPRCRPSVAYRRGTGVWDGLAGKPWHVLAVVGGSLGGLGAVLFDEGSVQLFSRNTFASVISSEAPDATAAELRAVGPPVEPRCARASTRLPTCTGHTPAANVFEYDAASVDKQVRVRARLEERGKGTQEAYSIDAVRKPVLVDPKGNSLAFELAGDRPFDCNGNCCDFDGLGVTVLASGVVRKVETRNGNWYRLAQARLCRIANQPGPSVGAR